MPSVALATGIYPGAAQGARRSPSEYRCWAAAIRRCHDPRHDNYPRYGGAGVVVCERWRSSLRAFLDDVGPRPVGTQLDRVDGSKGYEPGNCRWVSSKENNRNRRNNLRVEFDGNTIKARLRRGLSIEEALIPAQSRSALVRGKAA